MALPYNARNQYLKTQVETASKEQLVVMLFDGILRFTEVARKAIEDKKIEEKHRALMRAQAIIMELLCTVDKEKGGDVAKNLISLHAYAFNALVACNLKEDTSKIDEVQNMYRQLKEGWLGAMEKLGISTTGGKLMAGIIPGQQQNQPAAAAPAAGRPQGVFARSASAAPAPAPARPAFGSYAMGRSALGAAPRQGIMLSA